MDRFEQATRAFDQENSRDPNHVLDGGQARPRELVQSERLARWISRLDPAASEALRLAARCQHLRRWEIPRSSYPEGRIGYLEWRKSLGRFHAERAAEVLRAAGYEEPLIERVRSINQKRALKQDAEVQTMEDALCLTFLEHEIDEFAAKHPPEKIVDILQKTWKKMSDRGHDEALTLSFSPAVQVLVGRALSG